MHTLSLKLFLLLLLSYAGRAQEVFKFEYVTVNEGLAHSDAVDVVQDHQAFIWIATNNGIDRYDGYQLKNYLIPNTNTNGRYNNRISDLHISDDGTLWAAPEEQGVFFYDIASDSYRSLEEKTNNPKWKQLLRSISPRILSTYKSEKLFIGTRTDGVLIISLDTKGEISDIQQVRLVNPHPTVLTIQNASNDAIWVGTSGQGLWLVEKESETYSSKKIETWTEPSVHAIYKRPNAEYWIASANHVGLLKQDGTIEMLEGSFASINCIFEDSQKRLWVGTNFGLHLIKNLQKNSDISQLVYDRQVLSAVGQAPYSLNSNRVHQLIEDRFNNLWIAASAGGLNKISLLAKPFHHLKRDVNEPNSLADNYINTICTDKENNVLWIGTRNGFSRYDIPTGTFKNFLHNSKPGGLTNVSVSHIYDTQDGNLWIATRWNGIFVLDKKTQTLHPIANLPNQRPWTQVEPLSINEDKHGNIWIATFYAGLHIYSKNRKHKYSFTTNNSALPTDNLTFLEYDKHSDTFWCSSRNAGVLKISLRQNELNLLQHFKFNQNQKDGLRVNYTWPLLKKGNGNVWIGSIGGGLHQYDRSQNKIINYDQWIPEPNVETILDDENGNIWIGGRGLYCYNPKKNTVLHYDVADGLQSNSFKIGAAAKGSDGTLYFGGINGITYFKPREIKSNPFPPLMQITQVRIVGYEQNHKQHPRAIISGQTLDEVTIKDHENDFTVEFVGLNFHNPQKQKYAYMLQGYHQNWIPLPQGQRVAAFASLPAGDYTFMVKADNGDGVWADKPAKLHITILPPWYKTWWAYLMYVAAGLSALIWYKKNRDKQRELKEKIALEHMEHEKQKELSEMKLNFFTHVSHELRTPLTLIVHPAEDVVKSVNPNSEIKQKAELVHKQAQKLLTLVNQLMDFRKVESGSMDLQLQHADVVPFITEIFLIFKIKADEQNIDYALEIAHEKLLMNFDASKLEIILTNLLSNAFKHTPSGGKIRLKVWSENKKGDYLFIQVKDNGNGIHPGDVKHIFEPFYQAVKNPSIKNKGTGIGLSLVQEFAKMHGGNADVKSELNVGSEFIVTLPIKNDAISQTELPKPIQEEKPTLVLHENLDITTNEDKLLIVEDNDDLRKYLFDLFSPYLEVDTAENGKIGLDKINQNPPDIILSDVMMPELDGLELSEKVKNNPKTAHIPLVLITARAAALHELEGLESGADDYIVKPFNPKILLTKVQSLLTNRKKVREYFHKQVLIEPKEAMIPDADKAFIEKAMKIIEENLNNEQFSVQLLVQKSNMSQSAYYRKLKNITGQSVVEFIRDVRLKRAAQLLSSGQFRVMEVMNQVGMEDYKHFKSAFQKLYKVLPSEYAKSQAKIPLENALKK
jgi:signal transduction histidine kinase/ligand-binding sensor domain-containing protein/DNA-binding response OmpR family regulator